MLYVIGLTVVILKVLIGLGFVIFVHELGHFVVAKLCGVKCEKFYLGFDIGGLKFCKFRWGETEYGVGILPLGGYVKMLGQEDNPARLREEMERAKEKGEGGGRKAEESSGEWRVESGESATPPSPFPLPPSESNPQSPIPNPSLFDPRSFLAKSVPQRMAIISAGVIMNVIFAFLMAVVAFSMGVEQTPCVIGTVFSGGPAWQADLRVGDEILEIAGKKMKQFRDLQTAISLGDIDPDKGVPMLVRRSGVDQPFTVIVKPDRSRGAFFIGVGGPNTNRLTENRKTWLIQKRRAVVPGSPAAQAKPVFQTGDKIVKIDDVAIETYAQVDTELARKANQTVAVSVERASGDNSNKSLHKNGVETIAVTPNPMRTLGLVMQMGPITAIQTNSPAAAAGIEVGDVLRQIDGRPVDDPMTLPDQLNRRAGETVKLTMERKTSKMPVVVSIRLRKPVDGSSVEIDNSPAVISSLGIAYWVENRIDRVIEGSPAAKAGLASNDLIVEATLLPPSKEKLRALDVEQAEFPIPLGEGEKDHNWPLLIGAIQKVYPGTTARLTISRNKKEQTMTLTPVEAKDWFDPDRGFLFEPMTFDRKAATVGEAFALGGRTTLEEMTIVFRSVGKLSTGQVSARNLGGPVMIIQMAGHSADQGNARFLLFLTLLSANLAVLNILPIPVLDGGHLVFLIYEGIRGKPASERVQVVLTYFGLALILTLMVWVFGLDFGLISRR